jgi:hypothetical protein
MIQAVTNEEGTKTSPGNVHGPNLDRINESEEGVEHSIVNIWGFNFLCDTKG